MVSISFFELTSEAAWKEPWGLHSSCDLIPWRGNPVSKQMKSSVFPEAVLLPVLQQVMTFWCCTRRMSEWSMISTHLEITSFQISNLHTTKSFDMCMYVCASVRVSVGLGVDLGFISYSITDAISRHICSCFKLPEAAALYGATLLSPPTKPSTFPPTVWGVWHDICERHEK